MDQVERRTVSVTEAARILVDGGHFTLTELINKIDEVKKRHEPAR